MPYDSKTRVLSLLDQQGRRLFGLLARLTLSQDAAEDLLQELALRLLASAGFRESQQPERYAVRAAINLAFEWRRKRRACEPLTSEPDALVSDQLQGLANAEELRDVLLALEGLSHIKRQIVVLRYLEGQPFEEVGAAVGKTAHQARGLCGRALLALRRVMQERGHI